MTESSGWEVLSLPATHTAPIARTAALCTTSPPPSGLPGTLRPMLPYQEMPCLLPQPPSHQQLPLQACQTVQLAEAQKVYPGHPLLRLTSCASDDDGRCCCCLEAAQRALRDVLQGYPLQSGPARQQDRILDSLITAKQAQPQSHPAILLRLRKLMAITKTATLLERR